MRSGGSARVSIIHAEGVRVGGVGRANLMGRDEARESVAEMIVVILIDVCGEDLVEDRGEVGE